MDDFKDSPTSLVADVDCTAAEGKELCQTHGVRGYPTIKYGDPGDMKDYNGGRSYEDLKKFADENLGPSCGPANLELCSDEVKPKVEKYMNQYPMLQVVNAIIESDGWKFAFVMRLSPLMPNEPLNYACAMTSMSLKHMAISTIGSLPKTAYEVWLAAQAANALASKSSDSTLSVPFLIISNSVLLLLMVALCLQGYYKYHHFVQNTKAITKSQKNTMRRRSTLRGFNAESDRRLKLNADPQRRASSWHSQIDKNALKTVDGKSERKVSSCIFPVTGEVSGA
mmetsp:Transcript_138040/g.243457  ORF Transcript_138040/g.243457 Transcript_138040/m.243457 type:complete len:282 (+) Transcript_138040:79-924(+)